MGSNAWNKAKNNFTYNHELDELKTILNEGAS